MAQLKGFRRQAKRPEEREAEAAKRDFPLIRTRIVANSLSNDFEEARREWILVDAFREGDEQFTDRCELCNTPGLKKNFEISNEHTGKTFLVGSTCIKRFIQFKGFDSQEASNEFFEQRQKRIFATRELQKLLVAILDVPTTHQIHVFREASRRILGPLKPRAIHENGSAWADYIEFLFGTLTPPPASLDRVRQVLYEPGKVPQRKPEIKQLPKRFGEWASEIKAKRTKVELTQHRSRDERPDRKPID
ncbi:MAG: hypothetical protein ACM3RP_13315 [Chitinophagales bacterium]